MSDHAAVVVIGLQSVEFIDGNASAEVLLLHSGTGAELSIPIAVDMLPALRLLMRGEVPEEPNAEYDSTYTGQQPERASHPEPTTPRLPIRKPPVSQPISGEDESEADFDSLPEDGNF